jgi:hypothetical protein
MSIKIQDRTFIKHSRSFFAKEDLAFLYSELHSNISTDAYATEREQQLKSQGAMPNSTRLKTVWFKPWTSNVERLLESVRPFTWIIYPVQVRHMTAGSTPVPWHQDIGYQKALGPKAHRQVITCFTPLDPNPDKRATLEFADYDKDVLDHRREDDFDAVLDDQFTSMRYFKLQSGDCLLFGDYSPHRTFIPPNCEKERSTIEYRLILPEDALVGKDYFDIEKGKFVQQGGQYSPLNSI